MKFFGKSWRWVIVSLLCVGCLALAVYINGCSGSGSKDAPANAANPGTETFTNGGVSLTAKTTETDNSRTVVVTSANGTEVVTAVATTTKVTLTYPGSTTPNIITFPEPLSALPNSFELNRMAVFIAGRLVLDAGSAGGAQLREDSPGCDWFPDTQCTLSGAVPITIAASLRIRARPLPGCLLARHSRAKIATTSWSAASCAPARTRGYRGKMTAVMITAATSSMIVATPAAAAFHPALLRRHAATAAATSAKTLRIAPATARRAQVKIPAALILMVVPLKHPIRAPAHAAAAA